MSHSDNIYNTQDIGAYVSNIVSFRDFVTEVLNEIENGKYNIKMIKKISNIVEKFYNEIGDSDEFFDFQPDDIESELKLVPKIVEVTEPDYNLLPESTNTDSETSNESDLDLNDFPSSLVNFFTHDGKSEAQTEYDYYMSSYNDFKNEITNSESIKERENKIKNKKDNLCDAFFSNSIDLDKYNYLKKFDSTRVDNYIINSYIY